MREQKRQKKNTGKWQKDRKVQYKQESLVQIRQLNKYKGTIYIEEYCLLWLLFVELMPKNCQKLSKWPQLKK